MDWHALAACRDTPDPDLFFPLAITGPAARQVAAAKAICRRCPVLAPCRAWALARETYGIWGGLDEHQRARLRRTLHSRDCPSRALQPAARPPTAAADRAGTDVPVSEA